MPYIRRDFPILEFDPDTDAIIRPEKILQQIDIPERAVLCFFAETIQKTLKRFPHKIIKEIKSESLTIPIYELDINGKRIVLVQAFVGAPMAAGHIEELTALGCKKFIACGGCGVLTNNLPVGHLIIPTKAIRDEGTSYHYAPPAREISMSETAVKAIESTLQKHDFPFVKSKTWTTDAFYRETNAKVELRKKEGCITVEMETSAFIAVAKYNKVEFGQILYAGDSLAGETWDSRGWQNRLDIREAVLMLAIDACFAL